jgi:hypothetical protein
MAPSTGGTQPGPSAPVDTGAAAPAHRRCSPDHEALSFFHGLIPALALSLLLWCLLLWV